MGLVSILGLLLVAFVGTAIVWLATVRILAIRKKVYPAWLKILERIALSILVLVTATVALNSIFDAVVSRRDHPPGAIYLVNGHKMRMDCIGSGSPTLVLDAGLGNDGLIWSGIQPVLARTTRVCSYDRAGFGWSDALPPPRDADHVAIELHGLLTAAGISGPVVLMGHSIAGLYIRDFARRYPFSVAGLIFVDSSTPSPQRNPTIPFTNSKKASPQIGILLERTAFAVGLPRLFGACPGSFPGYELRTVALRLEGLCREHFKAFANEQGNFDHSGEEALHPGSYGKLPILIFSRDPRSFGSGNKAMNARKTWNLKQESLKQLSTQTRRIIAKGSGHYIQLKRPGLVEREVRVFLEQVRGTAPKPANSGMTTIE